MAEVRIVIKGAGSISPLGKSSAETEESYGSSRSLIALREIEGHEYPVACLGAASEQEISLVAGGNKLYGALDRSVLMALYASRKAVKNAGWKDAGRVAVNIGSSRGATGVYENAYRSYLQSSKVPVLTSPLTTLGNISSWVMQDLKSAGFEMSHSVTCSTALHSILNAVAWIRAGMAEKVLAGASEAPLTGFTIAQMKALKIYSAARDLEYPCVPCAGDPDPRCGMVLGEGAAVFALEAARGEDAEPGSFIIESIGFAGERIRTATSLSDEADCLYDSMKMALENSPGRGVDLIIAHAPGAGQGDASEIRAIEKLFGGAAPAVASNKWKIGHTLGAAGAFNLEYALYILKNQKFIDFPYRTGIQNRLVTPVKRIMINAAGFGGNAASLIVSQAQ